MSKTIYVKAFNSHLNEFFEDLLLIFPNNEDIEMGKVSFRTLSKLNVSAFLKLWYHYSYDYHEKIKEGDISFFLNKDYSVDIQKMTDGYDKSAEEIIGRIREPIKSLEDENKNKAMKYIQNLTELSKLYMDS